MTNRTTAKKPRSVWVWCEHGKLVLGAAFPCEPVVRKPCKDAHFPCDDETAGYVEFREVLPEKRKAVKRGK